MNYSFRLTKVYNCINRFLRAYPLFFVPMRKLQLIYFLFFYSFCNAQNSSKLITGKVFFNDEVIADVHIINKNTNQGSSSNDLGVFEIPVTVGDTLVFSHLNLKEYQIEITEKVLNKALVEIHLEGKTYQLNEITLEKPKSIFYIDPEIVPPPTVNAQTLKLPYANSIAKKDYAVFKFRSGGVINISNLFNAINGNNKRRKELQKITLEDKVLGEIRKHFTDDFFITDLNIKPENINPFLNFCFKKNIINHYKKNQHIKLTRILMHESKIFPQEKTEISLLEKK